MKKWIEPEKVNVSEDYLYAIGGHRLVLEILQRRGLGDIDKARAFIDTDYYEPSGPGEIPGMDKAGDRVEEAIAKQEKICVWGDFDVDGQTATTLLYSAILNLGANIMYYIPVRHSESHGMNIPGLKTLIDDGVELVITCDTGITAHREIEYARNNGLDIVITDHHDIPLVLPDACAIVNPKMLPLDHPLKDLPGVGCAYKLAEELYIRAGREKELKEFHDLVALGIISDIANQAKDTRYLLQKGLKTLRKTKRLGLKSIMEIAGLKPKHLSEEHIGFIIGPRLNSLGRLGDANQGVNFLMTKDKSFARTMALELEKLNEKRKLLCNQVLEGALEQIKEKPHLLNYSALVLSSQSWPVGVIGIVANRLVEMYNKPTVLIALPPGEPGRGSARSVKGCNISSAIMTHKEKLLDFGGHPMAAGLTIEAHIISEFRRLLSHTVTEMAEIKDKKEIHIDGYTTFSHLTIDLFDDLQRLSPFGPGNALPVLVTREVTIKSCNRIGQKGDHLQLTVEDSYGTGQRVVWWQGASQRLPEGKFDLAYHLRATNYMGHRSIQLEWVDAREIKKNNILSKPRELKIIDYRKEKNDQRILKKLRLLRNVQIWHEGQGRRDAYRKDRYGLVSGDSLVVWTIPPGPEVLRYALEKVSPSKVYLVGRDPEADHLEAFLRCLLSMCKYSLKYEKGLVSIKKMAGATAQNENTVKKGLDWLVARGYITASRINKSDLIIRNGNHRVSKYLEQITGKLRELLEETAGYRFHFFNADKNRLIKSCKEKEIVS